MRRPSRAYAMTAMPTTLLLASGIRDDWTNGQRQPLSPNASADPAEWARVLFHEPSKAVTTTLAVRDRLVALVGLRTSSDESFRVVAREDDEVLIGSDDRHLDFRASIRCLDGAVDVITFVQIHNLLGRLYFLPVRLVHGAIVRRMLRRATMKLDPPASQSRGSA